MYRLDEVKLNGEIKNEFKEKLDICNKLYNDQEFCFLNYRKIKEENIESLMSLLNLDFEVFKFKVSRNITKYIENEISSKFPNEDIVEVENHIVSMIEFDVNTRDGIICYNSKNKKMCELTNYLKRSNKNLESVNTNLNGIRERIDYISKNNKIINEDFSHLSYMNRFDLNITTYKKENLVFKLKNTKERREYQIRWLEREESKEKKRFDCITAYIQNMENRLKDIRKDNECRKKVFELLTILIKNGYTTDIKDLNSTL